MHVNTSIKPDQVVPSDRHCDPLCSAQAGTVAHDDTTEARRAALEERLLKQRITDRFGTPDVFFFNMTALLGTAAAGDTAETSEDIQRRQALQLATHAITLHTGLAIDDIYAHPLVRRADILSGHRMRTFIAAPVRGAARELIGVVCAADQTARRWTRADIDALQRIVAQFEALRLSQS